MVDASQLIPYFAQTYLAAQRALDKADRQSALRMYQQLLDIYRQMENADIEGIHRELAHDQLTDLYTALANTSRQEQAQTTAPRVQETPRQVEQTVVQPVQQQSIQPSQQQYVQPAFARQQTPETFPQPVQQQSFRTSQPAPVQAAQQSYSPVAEPLPARTPAAAKFSSREILLIAVFVALIGIVIFVKPEFIGFTTLGNGVTLPIDTVFKESTTFTMKLDADPQSLRMAGSIAGAGTARVYVITPEGKMLIFDSTRTPLQAQAGVLRFSDACIETCAFKTSKDLTLEVDVQDAILTIDSLTYTTSGANDRAPLWVGSANSISVARNTPTSLDLSRLFTDPDGDSLGFIATNAPGLTVTVDGPLVTFTAAEAGSYDVTLIASDGQLVTRQPFKVDAQ